MFFRILSYAAVVLMHTANSRGAMLTHQPDIAIFQAWLGRDRAVIRDQFPDHAVLNSRAHMQSRDNGKSALWFATVVCDDPALASSRASQFFGGSLKEQMA